MHKQAQATKQAFTDFADKVAAKWQLLTQPNTPSKVEEGESTASILADLVAIPTLTGNREANHEALEYVDRFLSKHGMIVKRLEYNGVESLIATTKRTKTPAVFLTGHMDVVPAPASAFQLQERDGKYFGRGVLDMKGSIAAYLGVVRDLQDTIGNYDFGIMITTDEEVGGFDGAERLAAEGYLPKVMVLPDGGSNWNLEQAAKGMWHATIKSSGKNAHGSRPWEGHNAIDSLMEILKEVKALFPDTQDWGTNTINVGTVRGGRAINQIPATAAASLDMRFISAKDQRRIQKQVDQIVRKHNASLTTEVEGLPIVNDPKNPYLATFAAYVEEVVGKPVQWITSNASHDGRHFSARNVPLAITYPAGANHHGSEEYMHTEALAQIQQIVHRFILAVARKSASARHRAKASVV